MCTSIHVLTPNMIWFTVPVPLFGMMANFYALSDGWVSVAIASLAAAMGLHIALLARNGSVSFWSLIDAR